VVKTSRDLNRLGIKHALDSRTPVSSSRSYTTGYSVGLDGLHRNLCPRNIGQVSDDTLEYLISLRYIKTGRNKAAAVARAYGASERLNELVGVIQNLEAQNGYPIVGYRAVQY
jgi:hypothetical protein